MLEAVQLEPGSGRGEAACAGEAACEGPARTRVREKKKASNGYGEPSGVVDANNGRVTVLVLQAWSQQPDRCPHGHEEHQSLALLENTLNQRAGRQVETYCVIFPNQKAPVQLKG